MRTDEDNNKRRLNDSPTWMLMSFKMVVTLSFGLVVEVRVEAVVEEEMEESTGLMAFMFVHNS